MKREPGKRQVARMDPWVDVGGVMIRIPLSDPVEYLVSRKFSYSPLIPKMEGPGRGRFKDEQELITEMGLPKRTPCNAARRISDSLRTRARRLPWRCHRAFPPSAGPQEGSGPRCICPRVVDRPDLHALVIGVMEGELPDHLGRPDVRLRVHGERCRCGPGAPRCFSQAPSQSPNAPLVHRL
jgi:hypothetical protein